MQQPLWDLTESKSDFQRNIHLWSFFVGPCFLPNFFFTIAFLKLKITFNRNFKHKLQRLKKTYSKVKMNITLEIFKKKSILNQKLKLYWKNKIWNVFERRPFYKEFFCMRPQWSEASLEGGPFGGSFFFKRTICSYPSGYFPKKIFI